MKPRRKPWARWLGHLIDSAANNHYRLVRARQTAELQFPPYDQKAWVGCEGYNHCDWSRLVDLWIAYSRPVAHVIANIPADKMATPCWVDRDEPPRAIPLRAMIEAYIRHLTHHVQQIFGPGEA